MIKSMVFLSLYAATGFGSWEAYTVLTDKGTSNSTTNNVTVTAQSDENNFRKVSNSVNRWKDYQGNWHYGDSTLIDHQHKYAEYEKELTLLRKLPQNALPTKIEQKEKNLSIIETLAQLESIQSLINVVNDAQTQIEDSNEQLLKINKYHASKYKD